MNTHPAFAAARRATTIAHAPGPLTSDHTFARLLDAIGHPGPMAICGRDHDGAFVVNDVCSPKAAVQAASAGASGDMWFSVHPVSETIRPPRRGSAEHAVALVCLPADLDVKPGALGSFEDARNLISALESLLGVAASAVVNSGHGLQPYWALSEPLLIVDEESRARASALLDRWGRLVAHIAEVDGGGSVDYVFDLARVMRVPGTMNCKAEPTPVGLESCSRTVLDLERLEEILDEYGIPDAGPDAAPDQVFAPRGTWSYASLMCPYAEAMVRGWRDDKPTSRHQWLLSQHVRLALAHRVGCLTETGHQTALAELTKQFDRLLAREGDARKISRGEWSDALEFGIARAEQVEDPWADPGPGRTRELGQKHKHVVDADQTARAVIGATTDRPPAGEAVAELISHLDTYLDDDDPDPTLFALAVAVVAADPGPEPLWGMLVGPPSSGKTERLRMLSDTADEAIDELTHAGLLSWTKGKDPKPCGVLARLPGVSALLTIGDFSTVLASSDRGGRDQLFADLRRVYDGSLRRDMGNAPRPLTWQGRLGILAAVTPTIDDYSAHADALGPRWLHCRLREREPHERLRTARAPRHNLASRRAEAARLAKTAVMAARHALSTVELSGALLDRLGDAAVVAAYARGSVPRDGYGRREIISVPVVEEPHRLVAQLQALARGLLALGCDEQAAGDLAVRCALDSVPQARRAVLAALAELGTATIASIAHSARLDRKVTRRALDDLRALRLAACPVEDSSALDDPERDLTRNTPRRWHLGGDLDPTLVAAVLAVDVPKRGDSPPNPPSTGGTHPTSGVQHGG